jgi:hypothetical protein
MRNGESDANSIHSTSSRNIIAYQRPFHFHRNLSLTDIRSLRNRLSSDSLSSLSFQSGIGSLSGKAIKWFGEKMLDAITPLEIRRRVWLIGRMVKRLEKLPPGKAHTLFFKKDKSFDRLLDDLLELSSYVLWLQLTLFLVEAFVATEVTIK